MGQMGGYISKWKKKLFFFFTHKLKIGIQTIKPCINIMLLAMYAFLKAYMKISFSKLNCVPITFALGKTLLYHDKSFYKMNNCLLIHLSLIWIFINLAYLRQDTSLKRKEYFLPCKARTKDRFYHASWTFCEIANC